MSVELEKCPSGIAVVTTDRPQVMNVLGIHARKVWTWTKPNGGRFASINRQ